MTETTCKMRRFSGIYVLYVKFDSQKNTKIAVLVLEAWSSHIPYEDRQACLSVEVREYLRIANTSTLRPKSAFRTRKTAYFAGFRLFFLCFIIIGRSPFLSLIRTSRKVQDTGDRFRWFVPCIFNIFRKNAILCLLRCKF